jgi:ParB family chromosome partitioning protein
MAQKNALGRGLGALIEDSEHVAGRAGATINEVDIGKIDLNPFQPRQTFDEESLQELASSIRKLGIIQPITVRLIDGDRFQLITGERRYKAAIIAGLKTIPAYIRTANDQNMLEMALIENIQRVDLDSIEVAISYQRLVEEIQLTQEELSERVGKKRSTISNYLRLLKLPAEIQLGIRQKTISMGHARALITIEDPVTQLGIYQNILSKDLSVRKVEEIVRKLGEPGQAGSSTLSEKTGTRGYDTLRAQLSELFQTGIDFKRNNNGSGRIVIPFKSDQELERILSVLDNLKR